MKSVLLCYFSGTGNTKLACHYIKNRLTDVRVDLLDIKGNETPDFAAYDFVGFATFTDWWDPPLYVKLFIEKLPLQQGKPAFVFNTCAGMSGKTLKTLKECLKERGFLVVAGATLYCPENYPPAIIKGWIKENNPTPGNLKKFDKFISKLNQLLTISPQELKEVKLKSGLITSLIPPFPRNKSKIDMECKYVDESLCNKCGVCTQICPYQAIANNDKIVFDENKCYGCWACFNNCPRKAIYTKKVRGKGYYNNPHEGLKRKLELNSL